MKIKHTSVLFIPVLAALVLLACLLVLRRRPTETMETQAAAKPSVATPAPAKVLKEATARALANGDKPNFDKRDGSRIVRPLTDRQKLALASLRKEVPDVAVEFDAMTGTPSRIASTTQFLTNTPPRLAHGQLSYDEAMAKVKAYLNAYRDLFLHGGELLDAAKVSRQDTTEHSGLQTVIWTQRVEDVSVFDSSFKANLSRSGEILSLSSTVMPEAETAVETYLATHATVVKNPPVDAPKAVSLAAANIGLTVDPAQITKLPKTNPNFSADHYTGPGLSTTYLEKAWLPMDAASVRLAWAVTVSSAEHGAYLVMIDAESGEPQFRASLSAADVTPQYRVFTSESPTPMSPGFWNLADATAQPATVGRSTVTIQALNGTASPNGWISDGKSTTKGDNVTAYADRDGDGLGTPVTGTGTNSRTFNFNVDLTQDPSNYTSASVVNLFYWCNWMHDQLYSLGFTASAGNFQGNDPVYALAQRGAGNTATTTNRNNSSFATLADGTTPNGGLMQMFVSNTTSPARDAAFDMHVVLHEYTHGLSNRLVGQFTDATKVPIYQPQTLGMGEGWSDFYSLALTASPQADPNAVYPWAAYFFRGLGTGQSNYYWGDRRYPYTTDMSIDPLTFKDIDATQASRHSTIPTNPQWSGSYMGYITDPHMRGEVWCSMLWEARARMIDRYGHSTGNTTILQLVTDGMKNPPKNPNFVQARDAILQADLNGGSTYRSILWNAFAKRGLGNGASSPASSDTAGLVEDYTVPSGVDVTPPVVDFAPLLPGSSIYEFVATGPQAVGGTVNEAARVTFQIEEKNPGAVPSRYWDGSTWVNDLHAQGVWLAATVTGNNWSPAAGVTLPSHAITRDGAYLIYARAVDNGGNVSEHAIVVNRTVTAETTPPAIAITYPGTGTISGLDHISGTASDTGGSGLSGAIDLVITGPDGKWWDGTAWQTSLTHIFANMTTASTWEYRSLPSGANLRNGTWHVSAQAFDWNNNTSPTNSGNNFSFTVNSALDTSNPTVQITSPANNSKRSALTSITGLAADTGAGLVLKVSLSINDGSSWWSGSDWVGSPVSVQADVGTDGKWSYTHLPTGFDVHSGTWSISATAFDYAGHQSSPASGVTNVFFYLDDSPPNLTITAPGNNSSQTTFPAVHCTASDSQGLQTVSAFLQRASDGFFWTGSVWTNQVAGTEHVLDYDSGTQTYNGNFSLPPVSSEGSYSYLVVAADVAGNAQYQSAQFTVAADTTPPTVTITTPADGSTITSSPVTIQGTATDTSGVYAVNCFIRRAADYLYWNGSSWGVPAINLPTNYNSSTHVWTCTATLPQPGGQLADGSYNFIAIATDNPGNHQQLDSVVTVTNFTGAVPVLYLRGDSLTDLSGHGHTATKSSDVTFTQGRIGQGFGFPGAFPDNDTSPGRNLVTIPDSADFKPTNLTFSLWVKFDSLDSKTTGGGANGEQVILHKQNAVPFAPPGYFDSYALIKRNNRFQFNLNFAVGEEKAAISTTSVVVDRWYHVVGTYDHQNLKLYVNGRLEASTPETRDLSYANTPLNLGRANSGGYYDGLFHGVIDEVQFFDSALEPAQIPAVDPANAGNGLVSWWRGEGNGKDFQGTNDGGAFGAGKVGRAFQFDGTNNQNVLIGDPVPASLQIQNEITLDAWIYVTAYPASGDALTLIVGSQYDATHSGATIFLDGRSNPDGQPAPPGHIHFQIGGEGTWHGTNVNAAVPLNQWVHIAATRKANEDAKVYYDGVLQPSTSVPWSGAISYDGAWFTIGRQKDAGGRPFNGLIDEVDVFNRALTQSEVQAIHDAGAAGKNPAALPAGLVSWWRGEDNATDAKGNNNGTLVTPEAYTAAGKVGQAFNISPAAGTYLSIPNSSSLRVRTFTIDAWVNFNALPSVAGHIFGKALGGGDADSYIMWYQGGALHGYLEGGPILDYPWSPAFGQWYHVAYSFDGSTQKLYVDGAEVASGANTAVPSYDDHPALIGADYSNGGIAYFFDGKIDEVDLFDHALSGSEINAIYTAGATGKSTGPSISIADASCVAGSSGTTNMVFNVSVLRPNATPISLNYATLDGLAVAGSDYTKTSGTLNIPANTASATITVPVTGNASAFARSFYLNLSNATNASINNAYASGSILTGSAVADFDPNANNPSQTWQYGHTETNGTGFTPYPAKVAGVPGNGLMAGWGGYFDGGVIFNPTFQTQSYNGSGTNQPADELGMFPTSNGAKSVVRWTAPASGSYQVSGLFEGIEQYGGGTTSDASIVKNGDTAHPLHFDSSDNSGINYVNGYQTQKTFSFYVSVNAGDTLDFRVGWGSNNNYGYDGTGFKATITQIAAPLITNASFPFTGGQLEIVGGTGPYTVTVTSGSPPDGIAISPSGLVTGTAANGPYDFTLHVVDAAGKSSDFTYTGGLANPVDVPSGIIAWWPAEGAGGDVIGGHHTGMMNGADYASGRVGRAFTFDGVNDFVQRFDGSGLDLAGDFTIECWVHLNQYPASTCDIIAKRSGDNNNIAYVLFLNSIGRPCFTSRSGGGSFTQATSTSAIPTDTWTHLAVTLTGGQITFYLNGIQTYAAPYTASRPGVTAPFTIGASVTDTSPASSPANPFEGMIDELSLYNRALTAKEISDIHAAATSGKARYDGARDFAQFQTAGSPWSCRWLPGSASMTSYDPAAANSSQLPGPNGPDANGIQYFGGPSYVTFNPTSTFVSSNGGGTWAPRQVGMEPGAGSEFAVLRWKAPAAGIYAVSGTYFGCDPGPTTVDVHIFHNANQLTPVDKRYVDSYRGNGVSHTQVITVGANDTVDFVIGDGGNGNSSDSSGLAASIVPLSVSPSAVIVVEQPAGSSLSSDTSTVSFGSSNIGTEVQKTFVIKNTGASTLHLEPTPISLDGDNTADFFFDPPPLLTLAPGASTTFTASFYPLATGPREAHIHIGSDSVTGSPFNIRLTGTGFSGSPHIGVDQPSGSAIANNASVDFSGGIVGGGVLREFVVKNTGTAVLNDVIATIDGANAADFTFASAPATVVSPNGSTTFFVRFTASATTARTATLHIASNDAGSNPFNVTLTGTASGTTLNTTFNSASDVPLTIDGLNATGLTLGVTLNFAPPVGTNLTIVNNTGTTRVIGSFAGRPPGSTVSLTYGGQVYDFVITYAGGTGNDVVLLWPGSSPVAWGDNVYGRSGDGTSGGNKPSPVATVGTGALAGKTVIAVAAGYQHSLALTADGKVYAWGRNESGQLGDGTNTDSNVPVAVNASGVLAGKTIVAISAGTGFSVALSSDGQLFSWGAGSSLGRGNTTSSNIPVAVDMSGVLAGKVVTDISAGWYHALARTSDGRVYGWGVNGFGQLGNGNKTNALSPVAMDVSAIIAGGETVKSVSAGYVNSMVLTAHNIMYICGDNSVGQLGLGASNSAYPTATSLVVPNIGPLALSPGSIAQVIAGAFQNYALTTDGRVIAWGYAGGGALGVANPDANTGQSPVFVNTTGVLSGKFISALSAGVECAVALSSDGQLFSWGINSSGQLGNGTTTDSNVPVAVDTSGVLASRKVSFVSAAPYGSLAVASRLPTPSIVVKKPGGVIVSSGATLDLGTALPENPTTLTITIVNAGLGTLSGIVITTTGDDAADFTIGTPGDTSLVTNATTTFDITFSPAFPGPRNAALHIASNDAAKTPLDLVLVGTGGVPITAWRQDNFGMTSNSGIAADTADPDHDGSPNLIEFALGNDPQQSNTTPGIIVPPDNTGAIIFNYSRSKEAMAKLTYQVEWTDDLLTAWQTTGVTESIMSDDGIKQQVRATVPSGTSGHRFVRLRVTSP
ncbi:MAG: LamG-like jellyroll fold domain-containing protein [Verrucomicrobiaceae bacterium]